MKPGPFDYAAPASLDEMLALLSDPEREAKVLAGGQSLIPMLNMRLARPDLLVDITGLPGLDVLAVDPATGALRIGAAVRQSAVAADPAVGAGWPLLAAAAGHIGHPQIRNRGTVCGSLVHHDPAAELPAAAVALDAELVVAGPRGTRTVPAADFFLGTFATAVEPDELLIEAVLPAVPAGAGWGFAELARRHGDFAAVGVAVLVAEGHARVVCFGAGFTPVRLPAAEAAALAGDPAAARQALRAGLEPPGDVHASGEWRREAAEELLVQALEDAWERRS
ncbi:FAD binding domain-containing protein [Phaeacidiphilus oryzae]|uniref:FAD binding domain-containing protein n=1 Tax=Phaeacidiphilus oryzae TaxID=348818 RepID=UPI00056A9CD2|nr:FAD binding domain-containing protein [Phaeacidiphilus oryzae]